MDQAGPPKPWASTGKRKEARLGREIMNRMKAAASHIKRTACQGLDLQADAQKPGRFEGSRAMSVGCASRLYVMTHSYGFHSIVIWVSRQGPRL